MSKQHICYSVRNVKKMKCQHNLVVSGQSPLIQQKRSESQWRESRDRHPFEE